MPSSFGFNYRIAAPKDRKASRGPFPKRLDRVEYFIRFLICLATWCVVYVFAALATTRDPKHSMTYLIIFLAVFLITNIYGLIWGVVPRLRDAGVSGWLVWLLFVPIFQWGVAIFALFAPTGYVPPDDVLRQFRR